MDRRRARAGFLITAAAVVLAAGAAAQLPIREARWLRSPDIVADLTTQPSECLDWPDEPEPRELVAIGRAAFRSPLLLGGQAARAGLSCASCHRNGRSNPHFHFPGISGALGTADVTASLMSKRRGDGVFNPRPIPDLAADTPKVSRDPARNDLKRFIHGLVVEEFDGREPPAVVLRGLTEYVRRLTPAACPRGGTTPITLEAAIVEVGTAVNLAEQSFARGDVPTAWVLIAAARSALGRIDERFTDKGRRALLRAADAELRLLQHSQSHAPDRFERWRVAWRSRAARLQAGRTESLFEERMLRRLTN